MIVGGICKGALVDFLSGVHGANDRYRLALYVEAADLSPETAAYTAAGEVQGQGYMPGGLELRGHKVRRVGDRAVLTWSDAVWPLSSIRARGALIYNATQGRRAIRVIDFGAFVESVDADFIVPIPPEGAVHLEAAV